MTRNERVTVNLSPEELAAWDEARGLIPMSAFVRDLVSRSIDHECEQKEPPPGVPAGQG